METDQLISRHGRIQESDQHDQDKKTIIEPLLKMARAVKEERIRVVAAYTLIACLASVLVGMLLGFPGTIGLELNDLYNSGHEHGIKDQSTEASLFGVRSFLRFAIRGVRNVCLSTCRDLDLSVPSLGVP